MVAGDADHEAIGSLVLHLTVHTEVLITRRVMDLDAQLLLVNILDTLVHVEDRRLIVLGERIVQVVRNETGLTDCGIAAQNQLDVLTAGATATASAAAAGSRWVSLRSSSCASTRCGGLSRLSFL